MKKIRNKLALYAVTVSLLCFILTSSFFYFVSAYLIQENARKMGETQLSSMSRSLEELLRAIDDEAQVLSTNASVHQWLDPDRQLDGDQANGLLIRTEEILNDFILKRSKDIDLIEIIPRDPNVYIQLSTNYEYADPLKFSVLDTLLGGKQAAWVEQSSLKGQEARSDGSEQAGKLAFVRKIRSSSGQELGAVIVYARKQIWQQMLTGVRMHIQVEDIAGNLIYQDAQLQADVRSRMDSTIHQVTNSATLDYTSWRLTSYMNTDRLLSQVNSIQLVILWVGVSCFIGSVLLSVSVSHRLTAPLHRMERLVAKIIHGNTGFEDKITIRSSFWNKLLTNKWGIVTMYIVIILIPLLISVFVLHYRSSEAIQRESEAYYKDQIESVARKLDMTLLGYNNILDYLFADRTLNRLMARYVNGELLPGDWQEPMKRLTARAAGGELGLSLYNNQSESIYQSGCSQSVRLEETEPTIRNKTQWIATIYACGTHTIHFGKKLVLFENYKDSKFYDRLGSIVLGVNELQLERAYSAETRQSDMKVFVVDGQGRIVSHSNKLVIGGEVSPDWKGIIGDQSHSGKGTIERPGAANEQLVVFHKLEAANWFVVGTIAADVMEAPIRWMRTISLLLLCTNLLIMALAIYWMLGR
ncbi:MAG: hypothetical protein K0R67_3137, partial [Paenibacillus sp.]|nr:hypothetical protein [Paenibacillus sp.]